MTSPADVDLDLGPDDADIVDPDVYVRGVPYATFDRLRRDDPVSWWSEHDGGSGFWAVTRYDDVLRVSRDVETFSSAQGIRLEEMSPAETDARRTMMEMDPPQHTRFRRLVSKPFSRREVMAYEQAIRLLARTVLDDALPGSRTLDFVERHRQAAADEDAGAAARCARHRRSVAGGQGRRAARQHGPGVHGPSRRAERHRRVPADALPQPGRRRALPLRAGGGGPAPRRSRPTT